MKWNKLTVKPLPIEEQIEHSYKTMWEGPVPEGEVGFEYTDGNIIYWMKMPKYNGELDD